MFLLKNFAGAIFQKSIDSFQLWGVGGGGGGVAIYNVYS